MRALLPWLIIARLLLGLVLLFIVLFLLLFPSPALSAAALNLKIVHCGDPIGDEVSLKVGTEVELEIYVSNVWGYVLEDGRWIMQWWRFSSLSFQLDLPQELEVLSYRLAPQVSANTPPPGELPTIFLWPGCKRGGTVSVLNTVLRVNAPFPPYRVGAENLHFECAGVVPGSLTSSGITLESPGDGTAQLGHEPVFPPDAVQATLLSDRYSFVDFVIENPNDLSIDYEVQPVDQGDGTDWLTAPSSFIPGNGQVTVRVRFDTNGLARGVYRSALDFYFPCIRKTYSVPVELTVLGRETPETMLGLTFDPEIFTCSLMGVKAGRTIDLYAIAYLNQVMNVAAAEFRIELPPEAELIDHEYGPEVTVDNGDLLDGVQLAFRACNNDYLILARMRVQVNSDPDGAEFRVLEYPLTGFLGYALCEPERPRMPTHGGTAVLNGVCTESIVSVRPTTWGAIKALYSDG